jgi:hypothetical protein
MPPTQSSNGRNKQQRPYVMMTLDEDSIMRNAGTAKRSIMHKPLQDKSSIIDPTINDHAWDDTKGSKQSKGIKSISSISESCQPDDVQSHTISVHSIIVPRIDATKHQIGSSTTLDNATQAASCNLMFSSTISEIGTTSVIKLVIKNKLFRMMKFCDRESDFLFNTNSDTVCGTILRHAMMLKEPAAQQWWKETRPLVRKTFTDHRNNCIKCIRAKYKGMYNFE